MKPITTQIVVAQASAAVIVAGAAAGTVWLAVGLVVAAVLLGLTMVRVRGRWLYKWISHVLRFRGRRRTLPVGSTPAVLLDLLRPAALVGSMEVDGTGVGIIEDSQGLSAVLEIGDTTGLLADLLAPLPALPSLLPGSDPEQPAVRMQLLLSAVAAPALRTGAGASATSYRQLTEGRILAQQRVLIAAHARRAGGFGDADLRRALTSAVRRVRRRCDRDSLPCRPLAADTVLRVLSEVAYHDPAEPVRESWTGLEVGGLAQVCLRVRRWPELANTEQSSVLLARLLTLPSAGTTVSVAVERSGGGVRAEMVIRLAAPNQASLGNALSALRRIAEGAGARLDRLDGAQLDGLTSTLPLGGSSTGPRAVVAGLMVNSDSLAVGGGDPARVPAGTIDSLGASVGGDGLMLGVNRRGEPVVLRLFRPEPTRAALIGELRCAQTIVLRALAVGASVIVQSGRPYAWEPYLRGLSGSEQIQLVAPGRVVEPPPATPVRPQLLVVDVGPVGATGLPVVESAWRATLLVRDELTPVDADLLTRADLAVLQPLDPRQAAIAATALGLGDSAGWLTRIRGDMLGVVVGRRTLRWTLLSSTSVERQVIGPLTHH